MTISLPPFTEQEQSVRKKWRGCFIAALLYCLILLFLGAIPSYLSKGSSSLVGYIVSLVSAFFTWPYPLYYCAYKKQGAILLTIQIILLIFAVLSFVFGFGSLAFLYIYYSQSMLSDLIAKYLFVLPLSVINIFWLFLSFKLRKINKNYGIRYLDVELTSKIQTASGMEELDARFNNAIQKRPKFRDHFYMEYLKRKEKLSKTLPSSPLGTTS